MNDLEICKRIAEIKGYKTKELPDGIKSIGIVIINQHPQSEDDCFAWYNPLTNDALCFQLMVEYRVFIDPNTCTGYTLACSIDDRLNIADLTNVAVVAETPNKAICLAIIKAHEQH